MQGRSWMAALAVVAGVVGASAAPTRADDVPSPLPRVVRLELRITGLGRDGCDVEIKPGHAGCQFRPVTQHINARDVAVIELKEVEIRGADRDCAVAITIREPGQAEKTVHRGLRISPTLRRGAVPTLSCYLSSPSKIARTEPARKKG